MSSFQSSRTYPFSVAEFLAWSFEVLRHDLPESFRAFCEGLESVEVHIQVNEEPFFVRFKAGDAFIAPISAPEPVEGSALQRAKIETSRATILLVIDGELSLIQAIDTDQLRVVASLDLLDTLSEGLTRYVHCGVRNCQFPIILDSFRSFHSYLSEQS